uniref:Interleukin n=1 Tax=Esox lucius TaxID=8010 RepID=A0A3P8Z3C1_ESOLU
MEHTFRIAFLLLVLSGCLQGKPTPKLETLQIMLKELKIEDLCVSLFLTKWSLFSLNSKCLLFLHLFTATLDCPDFICEDTRFEKPYGKFIENMISLTQSLNSQG